MSSVKTSRAATAAARRRLIVETAISCFAERGFHQTSIRDIAQRAGVSLGNLYNHFPSKGALIREIAAADTAELEEFRAYLQTIGDPRKRLRVFLELFLEECLKPQVAALTAEIVAEGLRNDEVAVPFIQERPRMVNLLHGLLTELCEHRRWPAPEMELAEFGLDLLESLSLRARLERRSLRPGELVILERSVCRMLLPVGQRVK